MDEHQEPLHGARSAMRDSRWGWVIAVGANLPVPLVFGCMATSQGGLFGMFAGIIAVWLIGHVVVTRVPCVRFFLVYGGWFFSLSQLLPVLQLWAGATAMSACEAPLGPGMSEATAFAVTLLTAAN